MANLKMDDRYTQVFHATPSGLGDEKHIDACHITPSLWDVEKPTIVLLCKNVIIQRNYPICPYRYG
ncbi:MAG: hypothetical protein OZ917_12450 [Candidatus Brocadiaceae bacterium]|nr:hypothetical protein [Candidatus Brocadiaceae bacterium]